MTLVVDCNHPVVNLVIKWIGEFGEWRGTLGDRIEMEKFDIDSAIDRRR